MMLPYTALTSYFGCSLSDAAFQTFLRAAFPDLSDYNLLESNYISSEAANVELGFANPGAVYDEDDAVILAPGNPVFSHCNLFPGAARWLASVPFGVSFSDKRPTIIGKAGAPLKTNQGYMDALNASFLVDRYELESTVVLFDYDVQTQQLNFIQLQGKQIA
jgi:hypothetical protein